MPVVSRADCHKVYVKEPILDIRTTNYRNGNNQKIASAWQRIEIRHRPCTGTNNERMDTLAYFERLVERGMATAEEFEALQRTIVGGKGGCEQAIEEFLAEKLGH